MDARRKARRLQAGRTENSHSRQGGKQDAGTLRNGSWVERSRQVGTSSRKRRARGFLTPAQFGPQAVRPKKEKHLGCLGKGIPPETWQNTDALETSGAQPQGIYHPEIPILDSAPSLEAGKWPELNVGSAQMLPPDFFHWKIPVSARGNPQYFGTKFAIFPSHPPC